jgi:hypothetical protein
MDVTSLLNSGTEAAVQQEREESSRTPPRSRTPWDADGYSLPLNTVTTRSHSVDAMIVSPQATPLASASIHADDSRFDIKKRSDSLFGHKSFSSRSSLSSTTSSLHSATHSRLSSLSTVNSCHPGQIFTTNGLSFMSENNSQGFDVTSEQPTALSPTSSLGALALVAEQHLSADRTESLDRNPKTQRATSLEDSAAALLQESLYPPRPRSPSDAILIKRSIAPALYSNFRENDLNTERQSL